MKARYAALAALTTFAVGYFYGAYAAVRDLTIPEFRKLKAEMHREEHYHETTDEEVE